MSHTDTIEALRAADPWAVFTTHQEGADVHFRSASFPTLDAAHPISTIRHADPTLMRLQADRTSAPALGGLALLALVLLVLAVVVS